MLSWALPAGDRHVVVWCQVSQDGWDDYAGSQFIVEFQLSKEPVVGAPAIRRQRLPAMLSASDREEARIIQNQVIASLRKPPKNHAFLSGSEEISDWYSNKFKSIAHPYREGQDIWFRYALDEHAHIWAKFIIAKFPECLRQVELWG